MAVKKALAILLAAVFALIFSSGAYCTEISLFAETKYRYTIFIEAVSEFNTAEMKAGDALTVSIYSGSTALIPCSDGSACTAYVSNALFNGVSVTKKDISFGTDESANQPAAGFTDNFTWSGAIRLEDCFTEPSKLINLNEIQLPLTVQLAAYDNAVLDFKVTSVRVHAQPVSQTLNPAITIDCFNGGRGLKRSQKEAIINATETFTVIAYPASAPPAGESCSLFTDLHMESVFAQASADGTITFTAPKNYFYDKDYDIFFTQISILNSAGSEITLKSLRLQFTEKNSVNANTLFLSCDKIFLNTNASFTLSANKKAVFSSSDTSVAQVNSSGTITAQKAGTAVITASYGTETASCIVTVAPSDSPAEKISLPYPQCVARVGKSYTLLAETDSSTDRIFWLSSDSSIAQINPESGKLTAYKPGSVTITACSSSGKSASCILTVKLPE